LTPHSFSFNSWLGWCPACEGLGTEHGADMSMLIRDPRLSLAEGAVDLWPGLDGSLGRRMLEALTGQMGVPLDVPFEKLGTRQRRFILHGTGDEWFDVSAPGSTKSAKPLFRFQYKGLYPALDEVSRLSQAYRARLDALVDEVECSTCGGSRLRDDASAVRFRGQTIDELCRMPLGELVEWFARWKPNATQHRIAGEIIREIRHRLQFLVDVGLDYLTLGRAAPTLSGGEAQRIRLASQVGSGLTGVLYVLDEPTIGLHPRDNRRLIAALTKLRDLGNTLLVVEHDREVVEHADQLLDFGPAAGEHGGRIVARGTPDEVATRRNSVTGPYLSGAKAIGVPISRRMPGHWSAKRRPRNSQANESFPFSPPSDVVPPGGGWLEIIGARHNNLKSIDVRIPLGTLTAITGVSGSGKSSLVEDVLYNALARTLHRASTAPAPHEAIHGVQWINKVIRVDQQPLGNTPTSNPATYSGVFDLIRQLFAQLPDAKLRGYTPRRFSFNVPGGRCERCEGNGQIRVEMHFLPDVWVECDTCRGKRYNPETLAVHYRGHSIADVLEMPCGRAVKLFENIPKIRRILETLCDVGLDYITLGQPAPTLSGGEAQRVKLAAELARPDTGRTLYLLDEPTTGLHFEDLAKLLDVLSRLVDLGNTVVVIEHNLDVIKTADWIIDLGPEAGRHGGYVVAAGTPEDIVAQARFLRRRKPIPNDVTNSAAKEATNGQPIPMRSYTGEMLAPVLSAGPRLERKPYDFASAQAERDGDLKIEEVGRDVRMPWEVDGRRWHTQDRVGRGGEPCRWDGRILARVVDRIQELGDFGPTNWNDRTVVEICGPKKTDGWFFHAVTGGQWLLQLKFRCAKKTFQREKLVEQLQLAPLNELDQLPIYGSEPRVKCKQLRGPWQEVQLLVHSLDEVDRPAFWNFLEQAAAGFQKFAQRVRQDPEELMPWKVLGRKWHFSRRGFPPGKKIDWEIEVLEELCEALLQAAPEAEFLWNNQQVVHVLPPGQSEPWATIHTKRRTSVDLALYGPRGRFALGRIAELGAARDLQIDRHRDVVKLSFVTLEDLSRGDLVNFLREHLAEPSTV
jgi:excinuclease ABC subunit A